MTVKELIKELQKCDQNKEVVIYGFGGAAYFKVRDIPLKDIVYLHIE